MKQKRLNLFFTLLIAVMTALSLAACGDTAPTATPKPITTVATTTTAAATTTTAAPTTTTAAATTTAAPTTTAATTTVAPTTAPATTTAAASNSDAASDWTEVKLSTNSQAGLVNTIPAKVPDLQVAAYVAPENSASILTLAQSTAGQSGYTCQADTTVINFYACTASGKPDLIYQVQDLSTAAKPNWITDDDWTTVQSMAKGNKSFVELILGTGILQAFANSQSGTTSTTTASGSSSDISADWTEVKLSAAAKSGLLKSFNQVSDIDAALYAAPQDPTAVLGAIKALASQRGYACQVVPTDNSTFTCTASGKPDLVYEVQDITQVTRPDWFSDDDWANFQNMVSSNKSIITVAVGTGLLKSSNGQTNATATTAATTTAVSGLGNIAPLKVDPAITAGFTKSLSGVSDLDVSMYVSDNNFSDLASAYDSGFISDGYTFYLPGSNQTKIYTSPSGQSYIGAYKKAGKPDLLVSYTNLPEDTNQLISNLKELNLPGVDVTQLVDRLSGRKTLLIYVSGKNLIDTLTKQ